MELNRIAKTIEIPLKYFSFYVVLCMFCILIRISSHTHKDFVLTTNLQHYVYNIRYD